MKLPAQSRGEIPKRKILDYLLAEAHPVGTAKAHFFHKHGFKRRDWELLVDALMKHARHNAVMKREASRFGMKYVIKGRLRCPDGESPMIFAVWFIAAGGTAPRLVTPYPAAGDD
jgi:filamentous hemagglutinin